jgi:hypothetical protein
MKHLLLLLISAALMACDSPSGSASDNSGVAGTYYMPITGAIMFTIKSDTAGYYVLKANNGRPSPRDSFRLNTFADTEAAWKGICGESYDKWMAMHVIGGDDWRPHFLGGYANTYNDFCLLHLKKGYASKEHVYTTGYCLVSGSECLIGNITRVNIEKLK